jgi:hypothetical protein
MMRPIALIAYAALCVVVACKPPAPSYTVTDPVTGEKSKVSVDAKGDTATITVKSKGGGGAVSVGQDGEPPKNLPSYIPLYPGAKHLGSFAAASDKNTDGGSIGGGIVTFATPDPSAQVLAYYRDAFTKAGLKQQASGDLDDMAILTFSKGDTDKEGVEVVATPVLGGGTQVQVMYSSEP